MQVVGTKLGTFSVEIDSQMIKWLGREMHKLDHPLFEWKQWATDTMALLAMNLVPGELISPPINLSQLPELDLSRSIPPYINAFPSSYVQKVVNPQYWPDLATLIDDYLEENPTRNRVLDMLPIFRFLDEERVDAKITDALIGSRPTLHYRLPNSEINDPQWSLRLPWNDWMQVEALANNPERLDRWSYRYWLFLQQPLKWPFIHPRQKQVLACLIDLS